MPLVISMGEPDSDIQAPLAIVILYGVTISTALNLLVLPAIYPMFPRDVWR